MRKQACFRTSLAAGFALLAAMPLAFSVSKAQEPIKIGFSMALTGPPLTRPLVASGREALVGMKVWESDINAKGGLLGRSVRLVYQDDQSNPATVPGTYFKLLKLERVDLVISGYATNMLKPLMVVAMIEKKVLLGLRGLNVNSELNYDRYFSMAPTGHDPKISLSNPFFEAAMQLNPRPKSIAIVTVDANFWDQASEISSFTAELLGRRDAGLGNSIPNDSLIRGMLNVDTDFVRNSVDGARAKAKELGLKIVYDKSYPPSPVTTDFTPIIRAIQASSPDIVFLASFPYDSIGMLQAAAALGLKTQALGGAMVGIQSSWAKSLLGEALNGVMNYEFWVPAPKLRTPLVDEFLKKYQALAAAGGADPFGYFVGTYAYAGIDLLGQAVAATNSLDDAKIADYLRGNTHKTIMGEVKFGKYGEWEKDRILLVQYRGIKGNDIGQFRGMDAQALLYPPDLKTGEPINFLDARK